MRHLQTLPLIVILMAITALAAVLPGLHAFVLRDNAEGRAFLYSAAIMLLLTGMLAFATQGRATRPRMRAPLVALLMAYLVLPAWAAFPFMAAVPQAEVGQAWFEMVSAFTTTGATLWAGPDLPPSAHLWRAMVGWGGGAYILIAAAAILSPLNLGGREIVTGRRIGQAGEGGGYGRVAVDPTGRFLGAAGVVGPAYLALTAILWSGLILLGAPALTGLCLSLSTLSTSGITCGPEGYVPGVGLAGEVLIFAFLCLALSRRFLPGPAITDRGLPIWRDPELRIAALVMVSLPGVLVLRHWLGALSDGGGETGEGVAALRALWGAVFSTLSFLTTTGFVSADWAGARAWSGLSTPGLVFLGLAIFGGGVATTAGGVKLLRIYALSRHGQRELERIIHPNSIGGEGLAARRLRREGAFFAWVFFMLFAIAIGGVMLGFMVLGQTFAPALVLTIATLTTTGPLISAAAEQPIDLGTLGLAGQLLAAGAMILGRIEILALIALFSLGEQRR